MTDQDRWLIIAMWLGLMYEINGRTGYLVLAVLSMAICVICGIELRRRP